jgi:uncharacterized membrane protein
VENAADFSIEDYFGWLSRALEWVTAAIELLAVLVLLTGFVRFLVAYLAAEAQGGERAERFRGLDSGRTEIARYILAALEMFIVSALLRAALTHSLESLGFLAGLVAIRCLASYFLERESRGAGGGDAPS